MYVFGPFSLDPDRRVLTRNGQPVAIAARAFDVLLSLVQHAGETVAKADILQWVWPDTFVEDANLSQQIFTLRKILGQSDEQIYIATVPRRGYRWVAPVRQGAVPAVAGNLVPPAATGPGVTPRLEIVVGPETALANGSSTILAISPDGARVVYVASVENTTRLYLRPVDQFEAIALRGTEGALSPFFSPDSHWIGFQCGRRLLKLPLDGGPPTILCDVVDLRGATWTRHGDIVYAPGPTTGLWRVSEHGGDATPLTALDFDDGERTHRWPHALPDGGVIFTIGRVGATSFDEAALAMIRAGMATHQLVLQHATDGRYLADGRLVWARGATLLAAPWDAERGRIDATPRVVESGVAMSATGIAHFDCSENGTLVHIAGAAQSLRRSLVSVDRAGVEIARHTSGDSLEEPRLSRDGRSAVVSIRTRSSDLWLHDFVSGALTRLTFDGENFAGIWGPGDETITYSASYGGPSDLFLLHPDRSAAPELLVAGEFDKVAGSWSPDGRTLAFTEYHPASGADIWLLDRTTETVRPFILTRFNEYAPAFSPSGRHIAYVTDESGRAEVMVVSHPEGTGKRQLSIEGGSEPVWSRDGSELFYRSGDRLMRVDVSRGTAAAGIPTTVFEGRFVAGTVTLANYDVSLDNTRFLMVVAEVAPPARTLRVTVGWF